MKETISRFAPAIILFLAGLAVIIFGGVTGQDMRFMLGGGSIILIAIFVTLNAMGIINAKISAVISILLAILSIILLYFNFISIKEPIDFRKEKSKRYSAVIQRLKDIRQAEVEYKKQYGGYTGEWDTLFNFLMKDSIAVVKKFGTVPDSLSELEAIKRGIISRDTSLVQAKEYVYDEDYMNLIDDKHDLVIDSLMYVPYTDGSKFELKADTLTRESGMKVSVFQVTDTDPFDPEDVLQVGSLSQPTTSGNWSEER
jgi:membrane protein implicated in regulation of membrane protease activity